MRFQHLVLVFVMFAIGCSNFEPYRTNLHNLDTQIYGDYQAYISEAEQTHTRSTEVIDANRRIVQQAELYYQSAAPTTQP